MATTPLDPTRIPLRHMSTREIFDRVEAERRADWPEDAIECRSCNGTGGDFWQEERCNDCMGRGFNLPDCDPDHPLMPSIATLTNGAS